MLLLTVPSGQITSLELAVSRIDSFTPSELIGVLCGMASVFTLLKSASRSASSSSLAFCAGRYAGTATDSSE